ncbi:hypothetical protein BDF19DRAFT_65927 [Syncephalis fuscata]|nr:hypothetical protein BDF19DRAFT_65927 [Syncephalis fuscata]
MATRMAQSLKLHRLDDPVLVARRQGQPEDWVTQETKRRTWWVCYLIDRTGAMAAGVPSAIDSRDMAVSLPSPDPDWEVGANPTEHPGVMMGPSDTRAFLEMEPGAQFGLTEDTRFSRYAYMLQLCTIMGRVNQFVIRPRLGYITPEENAEFEHLDALLAAWSKTLPSSLSFSPNDILQRSIGENRYTTHAMCLHTFHNVTVALLHRARYRSLTGKQPDAFTTMTVNATAPLGSGAIVAADVSGSTPEMLESIEKMPGQNPADLSLLRCVQSALSVAQIAQQGLGRVAIRCHVLQPFCYLTCAIILIRCLESPVEVNNPMRAAAQDGFIVLLNALRECRPYWRLSETYLAILTSLATKLILPATLQTTTTAATTPTIATS